MDALPASPEHLAHHSHRSPETRHKQPAENAPTTMATAPVHHDLTSSPTDAFQLQREMSHHPSPHPSTYGPSPGNTSNPDKAKHPAGDYSYVLTGINWIGSPPMLDRIYSSSMVDGPSNASAAIPNGTLNSTSLLPLNNKSLGSFDLGLAANSPPNANQGKKRAGYYYVDGGGSRLPRVKRRKLAIDPLEVPPVDITEETAACFSIPEIQEPAPSKNHLDVATYSTILTAFEEFCHRNIIFQPPFESTRFISLTAMNHMIELYINHMHPLLPFLHLPSLDLNRCHWALALAMAVFGANFHQDMNSRALVVGLQEFLRRVVLTLTTNVDKGSQTKLEELWLAQANLLSCICGFYSGNPRLYRNAYNARSALCSFCTESWALPEYIEEDRPEGHDHTIWLQWAFNESARRTGYAIWLLDSMLAYEMDISPLLALEHTTVPLPCPEIMFDARSSKDWITLSRLATPMPSLIVATELLYAQKHVNIITGEYSRQLLVHAILKRTWEVERYVRGPLSYLVPVSSRDDMHNITSPESNISSLVPSDSLLTRWLNAACSALNVLHYGANAAVAASSGVEHPTILHLHLAHIVLLAPIHSLSYLAFQLTNVRPLASRTTNPDTLRAEIEAWVTQEPDKARLSAIRAGGIFWHVRRYSSAGFYEPAAVFLASLILWAYATFTPSPSLDHGASPTFAPPHPSPSAFSDEDISLAAVINLDRPLDDELAAVFVARGAAMRAFLTGVGDLSAEGSPALVARRGQRLLRSLTTWGYGWRYVQVLEMLGKE